MVVPGDVAEVDSLDDCGSTPGSGTHDSLFARDCQGCSSAQMSHCLRLALQGRAVTPSAAAGSQVLLARTGVGTVCLGYGARFRVS